MFRQLNINELVDKLVLLEQKTESLSPQQIQDIVIFINQKTLQIIKEIEKAIA